MADIGNRVEAPVTTPSLRGLLQNDHGCNACAVLVTTPSSRGLPLQRSCSVPANSSNRSITERLVMSLLFCAVAHSSYEPPLQGVARSIAAPDGAFVTTHPMSGLCTAAEQAFPSVFPITTPTRSGLHGEHVHRLDHVVPVTTRSMSGLHLLTLGDVKDVVPITTRSMSG